MQRFRSNPLVASLLTLLAGNGLAQVVNLLSIPLLTRLYTPEQFGIFSLFTAAATNFLSVSTGRYEFAVMLPREEEEALDLVRLSTVVCCGTSLGFLALLWLIGADLARALGHPEQIPYLSYLPVFLWVTGMFSVLSFWFNRREDYPLLARSKVANAAGSALAWAALGVLGWATLGLVLGNILGWAAAVGLMWVAFLRQPRRQRPARLGQVARRYVSFPLYQMPAGFIQFLAFNLAYFAVGWLYAPATVGTYSLAFRAMCAPVMIPFWAYQQVVNKELTRQPDRPGFYLRQLATVFAILSLLVAPVVAAGPWLFGLVFGQEWVEAGHIARWLAPWVVAIFSTEAVAYVFAAANRNWQLLAWRLGYLGGLVFIFGGLRDSHAPVLTSMAWYADFTVAACVLLALLGWLAARAIPRPEVPEMSSQEAAE